MAGQRRLKRTEWPPDSGPSNTSLAVDGKAEVRRRPANEKWLMNKTISRKARSEKRKQANALITSELQHLNEANDCRTKFNDKLTT